MRFDRDIFFANVRDELFDGALSQQNVDGMSIILGVWENQLGGTPLTDIRWLAYMFATTYKECATTMWPITEYGSQEYLEGKEYFPFIGRGFVQLTWEDNYRKASSALGLIENRDLVEHPDLALDSLIAARVMTRGMAEGWFTGAQLGDFFNDTEDNPYDARTIINGHDCAQEIVGFHDSFLDALEAALILEVEPPPPLDLAPSIVNLQVPAPVSVWINGEEWAPVA
jgi:hypothetical protein